MALIEELTKRSKNESDDAYCWRILYLANAEIVDWGFASSLLNETVRVGKMPLSSEEWRKKFKATSPVSFSDIPQTPFDVDGSAEFFTHSANTILNINKAKVRLRDERNALNASIRKEARVDEIFDSMIDKIPPCAPVEIVKPQVSSDGSEMIALLSDVHYGLSFNNAEGVYDTTIAGERMKSYAQQIVNDAVTNGIRTLNLCLLGDLISGSIHTTGRIENEMTVDKQVIGVSELISDFIMSIAPYFDRVIVRTVNGNHSRVIPQLKESMLEERLDGIISWYCTAKCANQKNVKFISPIDSTIEQFNINGYEFAMIHGDLDKNNLNGEAKLASVIGYIPDYIIGGHYHVPRVTMDKCATIINGCMCGSGDDYTRRNRMSTKPYQVSMIVTPNDGVRNIIMNNM